MNIKTMVEKIHKTAVEHGWWEEERPFGEIVALIHSEISEAFEEYRNGHAPTEIYYPKMPPIHPDGTVKSMAKPEGIPVELADCVIRIFDYCGRQGIDIEAAIIEKMEYNESRPYRHGGKKA